MVSSIPGATSANTLGVDQRLGRPGTAPLQTRESANDGDKVELSGAALATTLQSVRSAIGQVQETLALGHEAQAMLVQVQKYARDGGASQSDLDALLQSFADRTNAAIAKGTTLASGDALSVQAEPGAPGVTIAGVDLQLGGATISVPADASADDPSLPGAAQKSLEALQGAMNRLMESARAFEAHQGFLGAAEGAMSVRDMDADGARLLALQVRQGLAAVGSGGIANVEPQAVLALFKA